MLSLNYLTVYIIQGASRHGNSDEQRERRTQQRTAPTGAAASGATAGRSRANFEMVNANAGPTPPVTTASPTTGKFG